MPDLRTIKCACGKCLNGISFDHDDDFIIFRYHNKNDDEFSMRITDVEIDQLISELKLCKKQYAGLKVKKKFRELTDKKFNNGTKGN